jgi:hypothetical protein
MNTSANIPANEVVVAARRGRKPRQLVQVTIGNLAQLNRQKSIRPLATVSDLILLDTTVEVPKTREELMAEMKKLPAGSEVTSLDLNKRTGTPITYGDLVIDKALNPDLDPAGVVEIDLHRFVLHSTEAFRKNLEQVLLDIAVKAEAPVA